MDILTISTDRLLLQTGAAADAAGVLAYLLDNRAFFQPWMPVPDPDFYTLEKQTALLEKDILDRQSGRRYRFFLHELSTSAIIGDFSLSNIVGGAFQSCHLSYHLAESFTGGGLMTEALTAGIFFAFQTLRLHRIEANIMPRNQPSIALIERLGFTRTGLAPKYLRIAGEWEDHLQFQLINDNWA